MHRTYYAWASHTFNLKTKKKIRSNELSCNKTSANFSAFQCTHFLHLPKNSRGRSHNVKQPSCCQRYWWKGESFLSKLDFFNGSLFPSPMACSHQQNPFPTLNFASHPILLPSFFLSQQLNVSLKTSPALAERKSLSP